MEEVANLLSRRSTTFIGSHRRLVALVLVSVAASVAAWFTWKTVRERLTNATTKFATKKRVRFAPTVHVRLFRDDQERS